MFKEDDALDIWEDSNPPWRAEFDKLDKKLDTRGVRDKLSSVMVRVDNDQVVVTLWDVDEFWKLWDLAYGEEPVVAAKGQGLDLSSELSSLDTLLEADLTTPTAVAKILKRVLEKLS